MDGKPMHDPLQGERDPSGRGGAGVTRLDGVFEDTVDVGEFLLTLWQGKAIIAITTALGVALGAFLLANTNPTYQADALFQLEEKTGSMVLPSSMAGMVDRDPRSVTEIEIIRSRMVLGQAVADQNLDWRIEPDVAPVVGTMLARHGVALIDALAPEAFARPGESIDLDHLVVPPRWLNRDVDLVVLTADRFRLTLPDGSEVDGAVGARITLADTGFSMGIRALAAPPGRRFLIRQVDELTAIDALRSRLSVSERGRSSGILEVRLVGEDVRENVRALEAVTQAYLSQNVRRSAAEAESSLTFIREQLPQAERNLREAEAALNEFRQRQVTVDLSLETETILGQITRIEADLAQSQRREDELAQRYTPVHPSYRALLDDRRRLETRLADLREQVGALPETQRQILNLTRNVELAQRIYTELLTRAQEVDVLRASTIGNARVLDPAAARPQPIAPRAARVLMVALLLGSLGGVALVLLRNRLRKGVQDGSELERLGLPLFATVNYNKLYDTDGRRNGRLPIIAMEQTADITVEALRSMRTSLHFGMLDARTPTLCITSSHPDAGKSFLAVNLAVVAAQAGQRVCLVDTDLRRGQLRRYFDVPRDHPGVAEVIAGDVTAEDVLVEGPVETLLFLSNGRYPPNPSELLMRPDFSRLVDWCGQRFDLTIFDTPPALAVTDPVIVARNVGTTILVARHDVTQSGEVEAAMKTFSSAGLRLSGAVLNGFDPRKARRRHAQGYGYGYGYRYAYKPRGE